MNQETNPGTQETQQEKTTQYKRSRSAGKNRPVLLTPSSDDKIAEELSETAQPVEEASSTTTVEDTRPRRLPKFFSSVGKDEKNVASEADPAAARIARATRNTGSTTSASNRTVNESKPAVSRSNANKVSTNKATPAKAAPPRSGFKTKYLYGIAIYVLVAMFVGQTERAFLVNNHLEKTLFSIGSFAVTTSTALYLLTLILLLVILARFDLIPRNLGSMGGQPTSQSGRAVQSSTESGNTKTSPPTMKQGVKGADDDLYQEYREQQRYMQRRERKK
jgi:hypothetical protein